MSRNSREERERLKEEYKEHYRKMRETKERLNRTRKTRNIAQALRDMDTSQVMDSFDDFLTGVKTKIATVEARLEVAMDSLDEDPDSPVGEMERDEELNRVRAKETLKQVKVEMGLLYSEIEKQASALDVDKTIGKQSHKVEKSESHKVGKSGSPKVEKSVGPDSESQNSQS